MYYLRLRVTALLMLCIGTGVLAERLCLAGEFTSQLQYLLDRQALTSQDNASISRLLDDAQATLRKKWKDFEVILFGSLSSGLAMKGSDVDCYIRIPNYNSSANLAAVQETMELLHQQPALYAQAIINTNSPNPFITFYHIPTQRHCDVTYANFAGVVHSKLFRYYFNLDVRFLPLGRMIKFWGNFHHLTSHGSVAKLRNYAWHILTVFYLQQKHLAPAVYELQRDSKSHIVDYWDMSFEEIPYRSNSTNTDNVYELLGGFFQYYSRFDFLNYVISPFTGRPLLRSAFLNIDSVPDEFLMYKRIVRKGNINLIDLNSDLCIQDIFEHNYNIVEKVGHEQASSIVSHFKLAAKMYEELPSDRFLTAIHVPHEHGTMEHNDIDDTIRKLKDNSLILCINVTLTDS